MADADQSNLTTLTVDLLSAYVANNNVEHSAIPDLIKSTHAALKIIDTDEPPAPEEPAHTPAVSVRKSLGSKTHIISMIDGKPYQTLKRHLSKHDLTPDQYRERYGLPKTYPMVAPAYSEARREIAKKLGLGNRVKGAQNQEAAPAAEAAAPKKIPASKKATAPKAVKSAPAKAASAKAAVIAPESPSKPAGQTKAKAAPKVAVIDGPAIATTPKGAPKTKRASAAKTGRVETAAAKAPVAAPKPAPRKRAPKSAPAAN